MNERRDLAALFGQSGIYAASDLLRSAVNFLLLPLITAALSTTEYGTLSLALTFAALLEVVFSAGLRGAVGRLYFDYEDLRSFLGTLALFLGMWSVVLGGGLLGLGWLFWPRGGLLPFSPYATLAVLITCAANLSYSLLLPLFYAQGQARTYAAFSLGSFTLATGGTLLLVVGLDQGATGALVARLIAAVVMLVPALWLVARRTTFVLHKPMLRAALRFGLPLVPHLLATWALNYLDRFLLGQLVTVEQVGIFTVGYQFGMVVAVIIAALNNAWTPWFFRVHQSEQVARIPAFTTYFVLLTVALGLGATLLARPAVSIMAASDFRRAWLVVPLIAVGYVLNGLALRAQDVLLLHKRTAAIPLITLGAVITNVVTDLLLIPHWGILGAGYGTVCGYAARFVLTVLYVRQIGARLPFEWRRSAGAIALAGLIAGVGLQTGTGSDWLDVSLRLLIFAAYPLGAWLLVVRRSERVRLRASLRG